MNQEESLAAKRCGIQDYRLDSLRRRLTFFRLQSCDDGTMYSLYWVYAYSQLVGLCSGSPHWLFAYGTFTSEINILKRRRYQISEAADGPFEAPLRTSGRSKELNQISGRQTKPIKVAVGLNLEKKCIPLLIHLLIVNSYLTEMKIHRNPFDEYFPSIICSTV